MTFSDHILRCVDAYVHGEVIGGGFLLLPERALPAIAASKTVPPISVFRLAVSPRNNQTHIGPNRTSARDNKASSAAGRLREPNVYRIRPAPT